MEKYPSVLTEFEYQSVVLYDVQTEETLLIGDYIAAIVELSSTFCEVYLRSLTYPLLKRPHPHAVHCFSDVPLYTFRLCLGSLEHVIFDLLRSHDFDIARPLIRSVLETYTAPGWMMGWFAFKRYIHNYPNDFVIDVVVQEKEVSSHV